MTSPSILDEPIDTPHKPQPKRRARSPSGAHANGAGPEPQRTDKLTEDMAADLFAQQWTDRMHYRSRDGHWYDWTGVKWSKDETGLAQHRVRLALREYVPGQSVKFHNARTIAAVEKIARSDPGLALAGNFDDAPHLLGTPAGVVDLRDGSMRAARPGDRISRLTSVAPDFGARCPEWMKFLDTCTQKAEGFAAFIQQMLGYFLTGLTHHEVMFFLYGGGANGKTVLARAISEILDDYFVASPVEMFLQSASHGHPTEMARLEGVRMTAVSELPINVAWDTQRVKNFTSGECVPVRYMRQDFYDMVPVCKLLFVGNHRPRLDQVDEAMRRRLRLVPFTHQMPEAERDPLLGQKLRAEYGAVLAWMIRGAAMHFNGDVWQMPEVVMRGSAEYLHESDTVGLWFAERVETGAGFSMQSSKAHANYRAWFAHNGCDGKPVNTIDFKQRLTGDLGLVFDEQKRGNFFLGARLPPSEVGGDGGSA